MPSNPDQPFDKKIELSEAQRADIEINQVRFAEFEETLMSIVDAARDIEGSERVIEFLKLGEIQLSMARRECTAATLREEADRAWTAVRKAIYVDKDGKASLIDNNLNQLVEDLGQSRNNMLNDLDRLGPAHHQGLKKVAESLRDAPELSSLADQPVPPLDRTRESDVHIATSRGKRPERKTAISQKAVESTRERAREKIEKVSEDAHARVIVYYQNILSSLLYLHMISKDTKEQKDLFKENLTYSGSGEAFEAFFEHFNYEGRRENIVDLTAELVKRIEFALKLMEQETGVDNILTALIPSRQLARLKKRIGEEMADGPDKIQAVKALNYTLKKRQEAFNQPRDISPELQRRLIKINLLGASEKPSEDKEDE